MQRILIVEDEEAIANLIKMNLTAEGYHCTCAYDGKMGADYIEKEFFDLILLDIMLPEISGYELLEYVKPMGTPVIFLTAKDGVDDRIKGLKLGADDYITKPFSLAVLRARVNTQLRNWNIEISGNEKTQEPSNAEKRELTTVKIDAYVFDFVKMQFSYKDTLIELSKTEQKLLWCLVNNRGVTLSRSFLIDFIWTDGAEYVDENALSVSIKRLRDKLSAQQYIKTIYGIGYTWKG